MELLNCENLTVALSGNCILENINFSAQCGSLYILFGSNGTGKTTLLRALSGLIKPVSGKITINDKNTADFSRKEFARNICYLPQNHSSVFEYQVIDFVMMGRTAYGSIFYQPTAKDRDMAHQILEQTGIGHLANRLYTNLSSGESQLVMLARALMQDTPFLLLDEPTSNLDFKNQKFVMDKISSLAHEHNKAVIVSIHDPNAALEYCDCIIAMQNKSIADTLNRTDENFYENMEAVLQKLYYPGIKVFRVGDSAFVK